MTEKHRDQLIDVLRGIANALEMGPLGHELAVTAAMGMREPHGEITVHLRIADPDRRLYGIGIEGLVQLGPDAFSFDKAEIAEHLSTLLAQAAINLRSAR